jgi:hypothetical protein
VDVARAVGEDLARADADDELRLRILGEQRIVRVDAGDTVETKPALALVVDEEQPDLGVEQQVAHRGYAVAVVVGATCARRSRGRPGRRPCRRRAGRPSAVARKSMSARSMNALSLVDRVAITRPPADGEPPRVELV